MKQVMHMPEFQAIGAACKRMRNILRQAEEKGLEPAKNVEAFSDSEPEEQNLIAYLKQSGARPTNWRSQNRCRRGFSRKSFRKYGPLNMRESVCRPAPSAATTMIF